MSYQVCRESDIEQFISEKMVLVHCFSDNLRYYHTEEKNDEDANSSTHDGSQPRYKCFMPVDASCVASYKIGLRFLFYTF